MRALLFLLLPLLLPLLQCNAEVAEFENHFTLGNHQLDTVSHLLLRMKKLAHRKAYGDRQFGSDAVEDAKKPVSISQEQPKVKQELAPYLFEGDIFLSQDQALHILEQLHKADEEIDRKRKNKKNRGRRSFHSDPEARWKSMPIKYRFHESLEFFAISQIVSAIRFWENNTCLSFENTYDNLAGQDFIEFFQGQGCYSMIGRNGGRQGVSIGENCAKLGIIEHEIGHALGLWHEQSRPDSTSFVEVQQDFILPSYMSDFLQRENEIDSLGVPYDLGSVMHYGSTAFSADQTSKTLLTRDPLYQSTIGQREALSFYDIETINRAYCRDKCPGANPCQHGGYPHPARCQQCICPNGLGGSKCEINEPPKNAECGGVVTLSDDWEEISSPDYPDPGYEPDQKCAWKMTAPTGKRVEIQFVEDFSFLCTSTCVDYVELKIAADLKNTGFRLCCYTIPAGSFVSESEVAVVIFRSQLSSDVGFKLQARATDLPARTTPAPVAITTTAAPTTIAGSSTWTAWAEWSTCSRSCGGCGIRSRVRQCKTKDCEGRRQEFSTCNLKACPVDKHCGRLLSQNKLCGGKVCTNAAEAKAACGEPTCCPPFHHKDGMCVSNTPVFSDFVRRK